MVWNIGAKSPDLSFKLRYGKGVDMISGSLYSPK